MHGKEFEKYLSHHPQHHKTFFQRPHWTRRQLFQLAGAGITATFVPGTAPAAEVLQESATPINKAKNVIFVLLTGAASHTDTFDLNGSLRHNTAGFRANGYRGNPLANRAAPQDRGAARRYRHRAVDACMGSRP